MSINWFNIKMKELMYKFKLCDLTLYSSCNLLYFSKNLFDSFLYLSEDIK